ncbi:hypothetical protein [Bartonella koehlerae]|uniref:hypothetical protein n=1 Tax=Bartonella koehlerae TaxID=92181 RepID=UPI000559125E|nr:hypothetical protein [Bartonella koehlerae]
MFKCGSFTTYSNGKNTTIIGVSDTLQNDAIGRMQRFAEMHAAAVVGSIVVGEQVNAKVSEAVVIGGGVQV